ncbi:hypothetical protein FB451DRAFT_1184232 [Mycena latifolia]|nr:hypothetical protein FB451DRAFT_1184232 [Mycena latifolia]
MSLSLCFHLIKTVALQCIIKEPTNVNSKIVHSKEEGLRLHRMLPLPQTENWNQLRSLFPPILRLSFFLKWIKEEGAQHCKKYTDSGSRWEYLAPREQWAERPAPKSRGEPGDGPPARSATPESHMPSSWTLFKSMADTTHQTPDSPLYVQFNTILESVQRYCDGRNASPEPLPGSHAILPPPYDEHDPSARPQSPAAGEQQGHNCAAMNPESAQDGEPGCIDFN